MSEFFFIYGTGRGKVSAKVEKKADRIARKHGAHFSTAKPAGDGWRHWFACPNIGFGDEIAKAVGADLLAEGIELP